MINSDLYSREILKLGRGNPQGAMAQLVSCRVNFGWRTSCTGQPCHKEVSSCRAAKQVQDFQAFCVIRLADQNHKVHSGLMNIHCCYNYKKNLQYVNFYFARFQARFHLFLPRASFYIEGDTLCAHAQRKDQIVAGSPFFLAKLQVWICRHIQSKKNYLSKKNIILKLLKVRDRANY